MNIYCYNSIYINSFFLDVLIKKLINLYYILKYKLFYILNYIFFQNKINITLFFTFKIFNQKITIKFYLKFNKKFFLFFKPINKILLLTLYFLFKIKITKNKFKMNYYIFIIIKKLIFKNTLSIVYLTN